MYQTKADCYLEITEEKQKEFYYFEGGKGVSKNYKSERISLTPFYTGKGYIFNVENSIIENALIILDITSDNYDIFLFECSSIFTKKGYDQLSEDWQEESYLQSLDEIDPILVGEIVYSDEKLNQIDGYSSVDDPDSLDTPFMYFDVDEGDFLIYLMEGTDLTENNPFEKFVNPPDLVECSYQAIDKIKNWYLRIPLFIIRQVKIDSKRNQYEEYNIPEEYSCIIDLTDDNKIEIKGKFRTFTPKDTIIPESWFFIHEVNSSKGREAGKEPNIHKTNPIPSPSS